MQTPEPSEPGSSLELSFDEHPAQPTQAAESAEPGMLGNLLTARIRQADTEMLGQILISTLRGALPDSMFRLERPRSLGRRLARRTAEPIGITITAGDRTLSFRAPKDGVPRAEVGHTVRGVVLSSRPVSVSQWLDELAELLDQLSRDDDATRAALERTLLS